MQASIVFTVKLKYIWPTACYKGVYVVKSLLLKTVGAKHLLHVSHIVMTMRLAHKWHMFSNWEHNWAPLIPFDDDRFKIHRFIRLKKILHKNVSGQSQWSIRSCSRNVPGCCGGRPFKWGFHAVSEWTDLPQVGVGRGCHLWVEG